MIEFLKSIPPAVWVLIGAIVLPIIVFGTIHLSANGYFERFKRKKK
jgi:hypothetical protein